MLDRADERLLRWYYEQTVFGRSSLGPQLDRAKALRQTAQVDTRASRAQGEVVYRNRALVWPTEPVLSAEGHVIGRRSAVTAQPTGQSRSSPGGYEPSHRDLIKLAEVTKTLDAMYVAGGGDLVPVLELYYGPAGEQFLDAGLSQLWSLLHATESGAAFLLRWETKLAEERYKAAMHDPAIKLQLQAGKLTERELRARTRDAMRTDKPVPAYARMCSACVVWSGGTKVESLAPLFAQAQQQAGDLWRAACSAWRAAGSAPKKAKAPDT